MSLDLSPYAAHGRGGMVAAARKEAAEVGIAILRQGGNAFDAAVATALALGVCEPQCSGLGGGGFMTAHCAATGRDVFVDFREVAPGYAEPSIWPVDEDGNLTTDERNAGGKSVCVPGELAGLCYILERFGTMSLAQAAAPAIRMAREGFLVTPLLAADMDVRRQDMLRFAEPGNPYLRRQYQVGERMTNPELADTMERIVREGPDVFYRGALTERFVRSLNAHGAAFTLEDFDRYTVNEYAPLVGDYRGYSLLSAPLPSSGGIHVLENLNMMERFPLAEYGFDSPERIFVLSEVLKKSFSDRARYTADPKYVRVPLAGMLSKEYAASRAGEIVYGSPQPPASGEPFSFESPDTTHFSVADAAGNLIAITQTISQFFGSAVVPADTGLVFNCQMRCFEGGAGKVNSVAPGKKPISSMCPTLLMKDGRPLAAIGSPGARRIISTVTQVISNMVDFRMNIAEATFAPRLYIDTAGVLSYEERYSRESIQTLEDFGQPCIQDGPFERHMGGVNAIQYEEDGSLLGVGDPRRDGAAVCSQPGEQYVFLSDADAIRSNKDCIF